MLSVWPMEVPVAAPGVGAPWMSPSSVITSVAVIADPPQDPLRNLPFVKSTRHRRVAVLPAAGVQAARGAVLAPGDEVEAVLPEWRRQIQLAGIILAAVAEPALEVDDARAYDGAGMWVRAHVLAPARVIRQVDTLLLRGGTISAQLLEPPVRLLACTLPREERDVVHRQCCRRSPRRRSTGSSLVAGGNSRSVPGSSETLCPARAWSAGVRGGQDRRRVESGRGSQSEL